MDSHSSLPTGTSVRTGTIVSCGREVTLRLVGLQSSPRHVPPLSKWCAQSCTRFSLQRFQILPNARIDATFAVEAKLHPCQKKTVKYSTVLHGICPCSTHLPFMIAVHMALSHRMWSDKEQGNVRQGEHGRRRPCHMRNREPRDYSLAADAIWSREMAVHGPGAHAHARGLAFSLLRVLLSWAGVPRVANRPKRSLGWRAMASALFSCIGTKERCSPVCEARRRQNVIPYSSDRPGPVAKQRAPGCAAFIILSQAPGTPLCSSIITTVCISDETHHSFDPSTRELSLPPLHLVKGSMLLA